MKQADQQAEPLLWRRERGNATARPCLAAVLCALLALSAAGCGGRTVLVEVTATPEPTRSPTPTPAPPTLTVCASGCGFATIQAALDDPGTVPGSVIVVTDPVHTEADIAVSTNVTIQGQGAQRTIVQAHAEPESSTGRVFLIAEGTSATIRGMTIRHGHPDLEPHVLGLRREGGGIANLGTLTLDECIVRDNVASGGGGIVSHGVLTVTRSVIADNTADADDVVGHNCGRGGGIKIVSSGTLMAVDSTISGNSAVGNGGGIKTGCVGGVVLVNCTVSGNHTNALGGGISSPGAVVLTHCTLAGNSATGIGRGRDSLMGNGGGGIYIGEGTLAFTNTLIADSSIGPNDTPGGDCVIGDEGTITANVNNLVEDGSCDAALSGDPALADLVEGDAPGPTHALLPGSPAIDAAPCVLATDQRGAPRPAVLTPGETPCDLGAFEVQAADGSSVEAPVTGLAPQDIDAFFEASWRELRLRDPEWIVQAGLADEYGLEGTELTDVSDAAVRQTQQMQASILAELRTIDREALTPEQRVSYDVYEWYLDDLVRGQPFMYYDYPITQGVASAHSELIRFFTELHPLATPQDAADYVARLWQVDDKFEQLIEGLRLREEAGVIPPRFIVQWARSDVAGVAYSSATRTPFYTAFDEKLSALDGLDDAQREALLAAAEAAINESVIPAFRSLEEALTHLRLVAPTDEGLWQFPGGDDYYAYLLRHYTTTHLTADEIHALGLRELERIHTEMRAIFDQLGYPEDESLAQLYARVVQASGFVPAGEMVATYEAIIDQAERDLGVAFDIRPVADVIVVGARVGGFYLRASRDGTRPGAFYATLSGGGSPWYGMPTLAYHEAVPGHHFQLAIAQETELPTFRTDVSLTGYVEGWALYAERLAWELGWYADDPYANLGRLQAEAWRAGRLVVDTGIHAQGWTFDQAVDFLVENTGFSHGSMEYEVGRYVAWPGQATAYMVGMLEILELRQRAMDQLGDRFDLAEFHTVLLANGSMPLDVLEEVVEQYVDAGRDAP
jgi:uncharacterized protein (DUF885 family)